MIIDTSAILAILYQEKDAEMFAHIIASEVNCKMSAANFLRPQSILMQKEMQPQVDNWMYL